jgi:crotonobetainyl-CoA:carnitine CoA-transferase CaiB-like acyl-CoA transferase
MYEASDGWIFLAAPYPKEWAPLTDVLSDVVDLAADSRFTDHSDRIRNDPTLAAELAHVFRQRSALQWEAILTKADVGCVAVTQELPEAFLQSDAFGRASGLVVDVVDPTFDEIPRLAPLVEFSRSAVTPQAGCLLGQHTDAVLTELGYTASRIQELRERKVIGG